MRLLSLFGVLALLFTHAGRLAGQTSAVAQQDLTALSLEELLDIRVEGAALHPQSQTDAPASVTVITASEIRTYGYRTLADALASTRGLYLSDNRTFRSVGVRGFNLPGDYASRFLVLVNGHQMADNIFGFQLGFGQEFPIDMSLVERIEVIRGPTSSIYGSNGIFATINIITKHPSQTEGPALIAEAGNFGEKKMQAMGTLPIGGQAEMLLSGSVFNNSGESPLFLPEFDAPETDFGQALRMDNEKGYHFFSNVTVRNWSFLAAASERQKIQPVSWGETVFNDRGTRVNDQRRFVEAAYSRELGPGALRWRTYYDSFHERLQVRYPSFTDSGVGNNPQRFSGDWVGTQLSYRFALSRLDTLTVGAEGRFDLRAFMDSALLSPSAPAYFSVDRRDRAFAVFAQNERRLNARWRLDLGARMDVSSDHQTRVSPRAALIYQPSGDWTYKFLYGRAFRNPSAFELFFDDGLSGASNPNARQESADTVEVDVEHRINKHINVVGAVYGYRLRNLLVGVYTPEGLVQYQNVGRIHASGFEIEMDSRLLRERLAFTASYALQQSRDDVADAVLSNSPDTVVKLRFALPLGRRLKAASLMQYQSIRTTLTGASLTSVYLADFTFTSRLLPNLDIQFGLRNAFNRHYSDPVALFPRVDRIPQRGRAFLVQLIARPSR
jgi:outer membrane receptor protein involved in Fe transport